ncbi:MBL fold metallo-hydrolase [Candidatus Saccharibacteria bacterium]|nr:MBL fold metallo-hydrolase [Candidatus Saccharibacteria bacterium]
MKITKCEHACLTIEVDGRVLVIDPGVYSTSFRPSENIDAVIITHEHSDHFDPEKVSEILQLNPNVVIFTTQKVTSDIASARVPNINEKIVVGNFSLQFFGHDHAPIVDGVVPCDNFGVVVNDILAYPGDSFELSPIRPQILAVPVSAPWLKINESMKYVAAVKPVKIFPTHDALLSDIGKSITYGWIHRTCDEIGVEFIDLSPSAELTI